MPFDLPPAPAPQLVEAEQVQEEIRAVDGLVLGAEHLSLRVIGNTYLSEERIRQVTGQGRNASQKIQLLNALYQDEGYPLVKIHYARDGDVVYVIVHEGVLADVEGSDLLRPFFAPLIGKSPLRGAELKRRQALAEIRAGRAGLDVEASYSFDDDAPERFTLKLDAEPDPEHSRWNLAAGLGNPGNRFIGRHFGSTELVYATPAGNRYGLSYTGSVTSLDGDASEQDFDQFGAKYDTVNRFGLYGLTLERTDYTANDFIAFFPGTDGAARFDRADARIDSAEITGGQLLIATGEQRLVIEQSLEYTDSQIDATRSEENDNETLGSILDDSPLGAIIGPFAPGNGESNAGTRSRVQDERYFAARFGGRYTRSLALWDRQVRLGARFGLKAGLSGDSGTLDDNAEGAIRRTARFQILDTEIEAGYQLPADFLLQATLELQHALRDRQVPQQQQWVLGGPDKLSAFLPGTLVGDSGSYARLQLQLPRSRFLGRPYRFAPFIEFGRASFNAGGEAGDTRSASAYGIKLETSPLENISFTLYLSDDISTNNLSEEFVRRNSTTAFFRLQGRW